MYALALLCAKGVRVCLPPCHVRTCVEERGRGRFEVVFYTLRHFDRASAHSVEWVGRSGAFF